MGALIVLTLILLFLAVMPVWPYSRSWGRLPALVAGVIVAVVIALQLLGHFRLS